MKLPDSTSISGVTLNVSDLGAARSFYERVLGFRDSAGEKDLVALGAGNGQPPFLYLRKVSGGRNSPGRTAGLYHVAYLFPSRAALGSRLRRIADAGYPLQGAADHLVSEALYLADPEGNGIELYVDRPRSEWRWNGTQLAMATDPLDLRSLPHDAGNASASIPPETNVGHVHLQIGDLGRGEEFYGGLLGFDVTQRSYPGALFLSAGGYHHHIGLNIWGGSNIPPRQKSDPGLASISIRVPDASVINDIMARSGHGSPLTDPDGIRVALHV